MPPKARPLGLRMMEKVRVHPVSGCWEWVGGKRYGYGYIVLPGNKKIATHRAMYTAFIGPIPDGLVIDHVCRNRACCNPRHLEAVTQRENLMRAPTLQAAFAARTHCNHGHLYDEKNTHIRRDGARCCRKCRYAALSRWRAGKRAEKCV